ncbi:23S rRNA (guanosine(2251)-2'-O)-methyltransferase RlmB [Candidatus Legionella polyplacis]|uniref:23S rRNA (Guanosine(2251)-2'-O)-methyltransferase RlmB n=1 Tax=Candidatus Legionella polyplacis TaxID=2005262 RepID=A0ABZ2H032_9GAMM
MHNNYVYGFHPVHLLLTNNKKNIKKNIKKIIINKTRNDIRFQKIIQLANKNNIFIEKTPINKIKKIYPNILHQGIVAIINNNKYFYNEKKLEALIKNKKKLNLIIILDRITDPQNLGSCIRTASLSKVDFILIPKKNNIKKFTHIINKSSCGSLNHIPIITTTNLIRSIKTLKKNKIWIFGSTPEAKKNLYTTNFKSISIALIFGSENKGIRHSIKQHCDFLFSIPTFNKELKCLNISVSVGICLYEIIRQKLYANTNK